MKKLISLLLLISLLFSGCEKDEPIPKPTAEFTYTIGSNGFVFFNNISTNSDTYNWNFGDYGTSMDKNPTYKYTTNKTFQVSLTSTGPGGSDVIVKNIQINNITGSLVVYKAKSTGNSPIKVYIDNVYLGIIMGEYYYTSNPGCGNTTSATATNLSEGKHTVLASEINGNGYWLGDVNITGGKCNSIGLN